MAGRILVQLSDDTASRLVAEAAKRALPVSHFAASLIEAQLIELPIEQEADAQAQAELELLAWVADRCERLRGENAWQEHVTLELFDAIQTEIPELYATAAPNSVSRGRLNSRIGSMLRRGLGARVCLDRNGRRISVHPKQRDRRLISNYTLLCRES